MCETDRDLEWQQIGVRALPLLLLLCCCEAWKRRRAWKFVPNLADYLENESALKGLNVLHVLLRFEYLCFILFVFTLKKICNCFFQNTVLACGLFTYSLTLDVVTGVLVRHRLLLG